MTTSHSMPKPPLPMVPQLPSSLGQPQVTPLPYGANIAFMWSPSGNTLVPVLLQNNTTVIPCPLPPTGPTPSALLPWPVATALSAFPTRMVTNPTGYSSHESLASRITVPAGPQPESPPTAAPSSNLLSRMTDHLSNRLSDPVPQATLASRLTNPQRATLADRLEAEEQMDVDHGQTSGSTNFGCLDPLANPWTSSTTTTDNSDLYSRDGDRTPRRGSMERETGEGDEDGEVGWKKTKRGRRSGNKIQGYRKRDSEREARRRRRR